MGIRYIGNVAAAVLGFNLGLDSEGFLIPSALSLKDLPQL